MARLFSGGRWVAGDGAERQIVNPANGETICTVNDATPDQTAEAIRAAHDAFERTDWAENVVQRVDVLRRTADALRRHADEMARLERRRLHWPAGRNTGWRITSSTSMSTPVPT